MMMMMMMTIYATKWPNGPSRIEVVDVEKESSQYSTAFSQTQAETWKLSFLQ